MLNYLNILNTLSFFVLFLLKEFSIEIRSFVLLKKKFFFNIVVKILFLFLLIEGFWWEGGRNWRLL